MPITHTLQADNHECVQNNNSFLPLEWFLMEVLDIPSPYRETPSL